MIAKMESVHEATYVKNVTIAEKTPAIKSLNSGIIQFVSFKKK